MKTTIRTVNHLDEEVTLGYETYTVTEVVSVRISGTGAPGEQDEMILTVRVAE